MSVIETRTFKSGNSVAIRLPKELGFAADMAVTIERVGNELKIVPVVDPAEGKRRLNKMIAALRAIGPIGEIGPREPVDIPDRPGM
jgi:antitoxin VapB